MHDTLLATPADLSSLAERVIGELYIKSDATVLALHGELGAGKTTFTQSLATTLGVEETLTSPTFVVMRRYTITAHDVFKTLVHIDAYRLDSDEELVVLGFKDMLADPGNLICIEWADKVEGLLPKDAYRMYFSHGETEADIRMVTYGYAETNE